MAEKTHDPTPKRLREARDRGDVPRAPLIAASIGLLIVIPLFRTIVVQSYLDLKFTLSHLDSHRAINSWDIGGKILSLTLPTTITFAGIAVLSSVVQGGITFSTKKFSIDPSKLNPITGFKNFFERTKLWNAFRGLLILLILCWLLGRLIAYATIRSVQITGQISALFAIVAETSSSILNSTAVLAFGIATIDVIIARKIWLSRLKMSRDEVMREHKESEGDPEIKHRREELHHELLAQEAISAVRDASVVVINPTHLACVLRYQPDESSSDDLAPTLLAKGHGALAARIVEAARRYGVPVVRDIPVAQALYELENGTEIPEILYEAVAEVLHIAWGQGDQD